MPLEERYVIRKRRRIVDTGQSETQRIAHRRFKPLKSFSLSPRRLFNQIHCVVDEHALIRELGKMQPCERGRNRTDQWDSRPRHVQ
jgi:hypothetical protein